MTLYAKPRDLDVESRAISCLFRLMEQANVAVEFGPVADGFDVTVGDDEQPVPTDGEPALLPDDLDAARIHGIERAKRFVIDRHDLRPKRRPPLDIVEAVSPGETLHLQPLGDRNCALTLRAQA